MKKFTLFFLGFFIILSAYTQNPYAVLYSELGERFTVYIDGNAQHQYPESNVKILDIQGTSHNVRIVFENGFIEEINKPLVLENGMESTFLIHKKSGRYDLSPKSQIPLAQASRVANAKAQTVVTYRGATQNTNTNVSMNTTSTGSGADGGGSVNVNINVSTGGNNPSGNVSVTSSGTGTTDTKPASDSYGAGQSSGKGQGKADKPKDNNTTDSYGQGKGQGKGHAKGHDKDHGKADKPKDNTSSSAAAGSAKDNTSSSAVAGGAKDNTSSSSAAASSGNNQGSVSVSVNTSQSGQASGGKSEAEINHGNHVTGKPNPNSNDNNAGGKPMSGNLVHGTKIGVKNQTSNPSSNQSVVPGYSGKINCNNPMSAENFSTALKSIESKNFNPQRLAVAKQVADANCLLVSQIKTIIKAFDFEDSRLEFAKYAYKKACDIDNYYQVNDAFQFDASVTKLDEFIRTGK